MSCEIRFRRVPQFQDALCGIQIDRAAVYTSRPHHLYSMLCSPKYISGMETIPDSLGGGENSSPLTTLTEWISPALDDDDCICIELRAQLCRNWAQVAGKQFQAAFPKREKSWLIAGAITDSTTFKPIGKKEGAAAAAAWSC